MKYPNGYLPRIAYHIAVTQNSDKILYFLDRQVKQYGDITVGQGKFIIDECLKKNVRHSTAIYVLQQAVDRLRELKEV